MSTLSPGGPDARIMSERLDVICLCQVRHVKLSNTLWHDKILSLNQFRLNLNLLQNWEYQILWPSLANKQAMGIPTNVTMICDDFILYNTRYELLKKVTWELTAKGTTGYRFCDRPRIFGIERLWKNFTVNFCKSLLYLFCTNVLTHLHRYI